MPFPLPTLAQFETLPILAPTTCPKQKEEEEREGEEAVAPHSPDPTLEEEQDSKGDDEYRIRRLRELGDIP